MVSSGADTATVNDSFRGVSAAGRGGGACVRGAATFRRARCSNNSVDADGGGLAGSGTVVVIDGVRWRARLAGEAAAKDQTLSIIDADGMTLICEPVGAAASAP